MAIIMSKRYKLYRNFWTLLGRMGVWNHPAYIFYKQIAEQIMQQAKSGTSLRKPIDLKLSIVKPLAARWFVQLEDYLKSHPDIIKNGFTGAGITADYLLY